MFFALPFDPCECQSYRPYGGTELTRVHGKVSSPPDEAVFGESRRPGGSLVPELPPRCRQIISQMNFRTPDLKETALWGAAPRLGPGTLQHELGIEYRFVPSDHGSVILAPSETGIAAARSQRLQNGVPPMVAQVPCENGASTTNPRALTGQYGLESRRACGEFGGQLSFGGGRGAPRAVLQPAALESADHPQVSRCDRGDLT